MKRKKIIIICSLVIVSILIVLTFLINYNRNKLMDENTYTILKLTNVGATPAVIAQSSNYFPKNPSNYDIRCFKLKSNLTYKIKLPDKSFIKEGATINYKKYGNFVFHREELEVVGARDDIDVKKALENNFETLNTRLDELMSQIEDLNDQLWDIQMGR